MISETTSKYAVAAMSFYDNELTIEIIDATNWKDALSRHSLFNEGKEKGDVSWLSNNIEDAKSDAFDADIAFDVVGISGY